MASNYEVGRYLGKGSFATVHIARNIHTRQQYAIKLVDVTSCQAKSGASDAISNEPYTITTLLQREIDVHLSVSASQHPNIVSLIESFAYNHETTGNIMRALVLDHCEYGDLQCYMKSIRDKRRKGSNSRGIILDGSTFLSVNQIRHAMSQVLCGLSFLHSRGIVHRDIKAPNIFLCPIQQSNNNTAMQSTQFSSLLDCQIKLGDFGLAVQMKDEDDWNECQHTFCGTPFCLAPEVVVSQSNPNLNSKSNSSATENIPTNTGLANDRAEFDSLIGIEQQQPELEKQAGYGQPADLWATGCLLYLMIVGRNPFAVPAANNQTPNTHQDPEIEKTKRIQQMIQRVSCGDWSMPANVSMDKTLDMLLNKLLENEPRKRGTARGILSMHPFFQISASSMHTPSSSPMKANTALDNKNVLNHQHQNDFDSSQPSNDTLDDELGAMPNDRGADREHKLNHLNEDMDSYLFQSDSSSEVVEKVADFEKEDSVSMFIISRTVSAEDDDKTSSIISSEVIGDIAKYQRLAAESRPQMKCQPAAAAAAVIEEEEENSLEDSLLMEQSKESGLKQGQSATYLRQPQLLAATESSSIVSTDSLSPTTTRINEEIGVQQSDETPDMIESIHDNESVDQLKTKLDTTPHNISFVSMKSLHFLPVRKYEWEERQRCDYNVISKLTAFFLGDEGLVIQRETENVNNCLWMHVSSDGMGILWGKLKQRPSFSTKHGASSDTPMNEQLLMEAYSRAPTEFSKRSLSSLLTLSCHDIVSLYESLEAKVEEVKLSTPKIELHLYTTLNDTADNTSQHELFAKTMLMIENDIQTTFADGTTVRLSSSDGIITVKRNHESTSQFKVDSAKFISTLKADRPLPPPNSSNMNGIFHHQIFVNYLCVFMESARECLLIDDPICNDTQIVAYPAVVKKVAMQGWHREEWTAMRRQLYVLRIK